MFKKGMIIPIKNLNEWNRALRILEQETDYVWSGGEGEPTAMSSDAFRKYAGDCAILIREAEKNNVLCFGTLTMILRHTELKGNDVFSLGEIIQTMRRF